VISKWFIHFIWKKRYNEIDVIDKFTSHENHNNMKCQSHTLTNLVHIFCSSMLYPSLKIQNFLSNKQKIYIKMLWASITYVVLREMHDSSVVTIYHKWPRITFNYLKVKNQILSHIVCQVFHNKQHTTPW